MVRSPDPRFFEQAIFLMREDALNTDGVSPDQVVAEARQVAAGYIRRNSSLGRKFSRLSPPVFAILGAAATGIVWAVTVFI